MYGVDRRYIQGYEPLDPIPDPIPETPQHHTILPDSKPDPIPETRQPHTISLIESITQAPTLHHTDTEIHNGKQYLILKDFTDSAIESEIKLKFFEIRNIFNEKLMRIIIRNANSACRRIIHCLAADIMIFHWTDEGQVI